jgi:hypothetical protein
MGFLLLLSHIFLLVSLAYSLLPIPLFSLFLLTNNQHNQQDILSGQNRRHFFHLLLRHLGWSPLKISSQMNPRILHAPEQLSCLKTPSPNVLYLSYSLSLAREARQPNIDLTCKGELARNLRTAFRKQIA